MRDAEDIAAFVKSPVGRYIADPAFLYCCPSPTLLAVQWRALDVPGMQRLIRALAVNFTLRGHRVLVDASHLGTVRPMSFALLARHLAFDPSHGEVRIQRRAIVAASGATARFMRDFYRHCAPPAATRVLATREEATRWLEIPDGPAFLKDFDRLEARCYPVANDARALRDLLARASVRTLDQAAAALGCERRTLQRRLREQGTSFRQEFDRSRIARAKALLQDDRVSITEIALEVGCQSLQHFSWLFHKVTGEAPSLWRRRNA